MREEGGSPSTRHSDPPPDQHHHCGYSHGMMEAVMLAGEEETDDGDYERICGDA
jgi:hypothetical protein